MLRVDYITNRVFNSRTYILFDEKYDRVWLVDCGDADKVLEMIGKMSVEGVLLTHAHSDHIYGLEELIKRFPAVKIYTNTAGVEALKSPKLNISHYHSEYPDISIDAPNNVCVLQEGYELEVLGVPAHIYETPGHAPSCLTYIIGQMAFTGDSYIPGVKVFTGFPHANKKEAEASVERILQFSEECQIMPGHTLKPDTSGIFL